MQRYWLPPKKCKKNIIQTKSLFKDRTSSEFDRKYALVRKYSHFSIYILFLINNTRKSSNFLPNSFPKRHPLLLPSSALISDCLIIILFYYFEVFSFVYLALPEIPRPFKIPESCNERREVQAIQNQKANSQGIDVGRFQEMKLLVQMEDRRIRVIIQAKAVKMMGNTESESMEEPKTTSLPTRSQLSTPRTTQKIDFAGQFLLAMQKMAGNDPTTVNSVQEAPVSQQNLPSGSSSSASNLENPGQSRPSKSVFHNFQKHLVTTLKMGIAVNKTNSKNDPTVHLAQRMWRLFQKSNYYSKRILHFLFGVEGGLPAPFEGFAEVASVYPQYEIELAQQYLREEVSRQGKRLLGRSLLCHRRMQRGEEFQSYFQKFLEEIQSGPISRRLPKAAKLKLLNSLNKQ